MDLVQDCFLVQHVLAPTRANNVLDLVLSPEVGLVENLEIREHFSNSDHNLLVGELVCKTYITSNNQIGSDFKKGDWVGLRTDLEVIKWEEEIAGLLTKYGDNFCILLSEAIDKYIPKKHMIWEIILNLMTRKVMKVRKCKYKMWKRYQETRP